MESDIAVAWAAIVTVAGGLFALLKLMHITINSSCWESRVEIEFSPTTTPRVTPTTTPKSSVGAPAVEITPPTPNVTPEDE